MRAIFVPPWSTITNSTIIPWTIIVIIICWKLGTIIVGHGISSSSTIARHMQYIVSLRAFDVECVWQMLYCTCYWNPPGQLAVEVERNCWPVDGSYSNPTKTLHWDPQIRAHWDPKSVHIFRPCTIEILRSVHSSLKESPSICLHFTINLWK